MFGGFELVMVEHYCDSVIVCNVTVIAMKYVILRVIILAEYVLLYPLMHVLSSKMMN